MKDIDSVHLMNSYFIRFLFQWNCCVVRFVGSDMHTRTQVCTYVCTYVLVKADLFLCPVYWICIVKNGSFTLPEGQ